MAKNRPFMFYEHTTSMCVQCLRRIEANIIFQDDRVWMRKWCPEHGHSTVLIATDIDYWRKGREVFIKPPEMPLRFNTKMKYGCPYDCGLCSDHMQHSCLTILEITDHCNLRCPVCYAESEGRPQSHLPLATIERMLDAVIANEGEPDVVQISGGEPTTHPELFAILDAAKQRPIRHLMLNTNGVRLANEPDFADQLADYAPGFEVYLQFDSLRGDALQTLRGSDLRSVRERALENLNRVGLSTTLVVTVARGVNDDEIGQIVEFAASQPCVRGVTLQPVQFAGRLDGVDTAHRLTHTEVRQKLLEQTSLFSEQDIVPVPCNPDALSMGYALKEGNGIVPLTRYVTPEALIAGQRNTMVFESDADLKAEVFKLFATNHSPESQASCLSSLLCCLPKVQAPADITYERVFRVLIMAFMDAANFDVRAMKKSCVHIAQPDGRIIPFESYNLLYRNGEDGILAERRGEVFQRFNQQKGKEQ